MKKVNGEKKILFLSDLHSGHQVGLTAPHWQYEVIEATDDPCLLRRNKHALVQRECWNFYADQIRFNGPYDLIAIMGDCIDGKGKRSGGSEMLEPTCEGQVRIAVAAIKHAIKHSVKNVPVVMVYGTQYHTGEDEDWENLIASEIGARKIGSHEWVEMEGVTFDLKHHLGNSSIPHGRATPLAREWLWNELWAAREQQPKAQVILRAHVHHHTFCGNADYIAMSLPALQGYGSKFGARRCSGTVDFGFITFTVNNGSFSWQTHIARPKGLSTTALKF